MIKTLSPLNINACRFFLIMLCLFIINFSFKAYSFERNYFGSVSSAYTNEDDGHIYLNTGSYYVVEYEQEKYLVTASHVTQGDQKSDPALPVERLADIENDLEVFKISNSTPAFATYNKQIKAFTIAPEILMDSALKLIKVGRSTYIPKGNWIKASIMDWKPGNSFVADSYSYSDFDTQNLAQGIFSNEIYLNYKILPGMSGSPLITAYPYINSINPKGDLNILLGTAVRYNRYFLGSTYTKSSILVALIEQFKTGKRGKLSELNWFLRKGLTYRKSSIIEEVNFCGSQGFSGGGTQGDGGGGTQGDGGGFSNISNLPCMDIAVRYKNKPVYGLMDNQDRFIFPYFAFIADLKNNLAAFNLVQSGSKDFIKQRILKRAADLNSMNSSFCFLEMIDSNVVIHLKKIWDPKAREFVNLPSFNLDYDFSKINFLKKINSPLSSTLFSVDLRGLIYDVYKEYKESSVNAPLDYTSVAHIKIGVGSDSFANDIITKCSLMK